MKCDVCGHEMVKWDLSAPRRTPVRLPAFRGVRAAARDPDARPERVAGARGRARGRGSGGYRGVPPMAASPTNGARGRPDGEIALPRRGFTGTLRLFALRLLRSSRFAYRFPD